MYTITSVLTAGRVGVPVQRVSTGRYSEYANVPAIAAVIAVYRRKRVMRCMEG